MGSHGACFRMSSGRSSALCARRRSNLAPCNMLRMLAITMCSRSCSVMSLTCLARSAFAFAHQLPILISRMQQYLRNLPKLLEAPLTLPGKLATWPTRRILPRSLATSPTLLLPPLLLHQWTCRHIGAAVTAKAFRYTRACAPCRSLTRLATVTTHLR